MKIEYFKETGGATGHKVTHFRASDRMVYYKAHKKVELSKGQLDKIKVSKFNTIKKYTVWLVDGTYIRDYVDLDFTSGGNGGRYRYVPEKEIWIEKTMSIEDKIATAFHEYFECEFMQNEGMSYNDAHDKANVLEKAIRKNIKNDRIKG